MTEKIAEDSLKDKAVDEEIVLRELLQCSREFKAFYQEERQKIKSTILWIPNGSLDEFDALPEGHLARANRHYNGDWVIILRNTPATMDDVTIVAHELAHLAIEGEGYSFVGAYLDNDDEDIVTLAFTLNNMIHDPLVVKKLKAYGFKLQEEYVTEYRNALILIGSIKSEPTGIRRIRTTFEYVQTLLEMDILFPEDNETCQEYISEFEKKMPLLTAKGKKLYKQIVETGYDNPEKVRNIFKQVLGDYKPIDDLIRVI